MTMMTMGATAKGTFIMSTQLGSVNGISSLVRKLESTFAISFQVLTVILLMEYSILGAFVGAHLGKPCNFLRICLPLSQYIYCDSNFTCRCRSDLPGKQRSSMCIASFSFSSSLLKHIFIPFWMTF